MIFSIGGALVILLGATVVLALLHPAVPLRRLGRLAA